MNDDFLHEMREPPRPEFLAQLKGKLDQRTLAAQPRQRRSFSFIRGLITGLLLAGAGLAIAAATLNDMPAALRVLVRAPVQFLARVLPGGGGPRSSEQAKSQDHHGAVPLGPAWFPTHPDAQAASEVAGPPSAPEAKAGAPARTGSARAQDTQTASAGSNSPNFERIAVIASPTTFVIAQHAATGGRAVVELAGAPVLRLCQSQPFGPPEIIEVSRRLSVQELSTCSNNGLRDILEVKLGYQGIVLVRSRLYGPLKLSGRDLFLALAGKLPDPRQPERLIDNPNVSWNQVDPTLPYDRIELIGPALASVPGRLSIELLMDAGCNTYPRMASLREQDPGRYEEVCRSVREDGVYRESTNAGGAMSPLFTDQLVTNPTAIGILTLEQFQQSRDKLIAIPIDGVDPTEANIASSAYPLSRTLYIYAIRRRVFGSRSFRTLVRDNMGATYRFGSDLSGWGFLQLDPDERAAILANVDEFKDSRN